MDGRNIATASEDSTARIWDASTFESSKELKHNGIVFSVAFNPRELGWLQAAVDNVVRLWDTESFDAVLELRGHSAYVHAVAFSPDGTMLASGSGDSTVRIWDSLLSPRAPHLRPTPARA